MIIQGLDHFMPVGDAHVFPSLLTPVLKKLSFQSHQLLFSQASEVRGKNTLERKFAYTSIELTTTSQVMSQDMLTTETPESALETYKQQTH